MKDGCDELKREDNGLIGLETLYGQEWGWGSQGDDEVERELKENGMEWGKKTDDTKGMDRSFQYGQ